MKTKFLVTALACLSISAGAQQSDKTNEQAARHEVKSPRDVATGQASGKRQHSAASDASAGTVREHGSGQATGKTMAQDDWSPRSNRTSGDPHVQEVSSSQGDAAAVRESPTRRSEGLRESPTKASTGKTTRVAAGDVDGDGAPDVAATNSEVKSPRDAATGQASGKRQHGALPAPKK